jgi:hypothetical protein
MRTTADALDLTAARLEELGAEQESLRAELRQQVEEFGFTPPRADKSKRLLADGATLALADRLPEGTPRNLRMLFSKAVETKEAAPRLRVQKIGDECHAERE